MKLKTIRTKILKKLGLHMLYLYLRYKKEINSLYGYSLKEGWASNEDADWKERTDYWLRCE
jgi:hypothetical protein